MAQFEPLKDEIEKLGALLYVAAEKRTGVFHPEKFFAEHQVSFPFLLDEDRAEVLGDLGVFLERSFPTPAGLADPRRGSLGEVLQVALPLADGLGIEIQDLGDVRDPAVAEFGRLDGGVAAAIVLAQGPGEGAHGLFDMAGIG